MYITQMINITHMIIRLLTIRTEHTLKQLQPMIHAIFLPISENILGPGRLLGDLGGRMLVRDFYGKGVLFHEKRVDFSDHSCKIHKKG
jgi:hypothetical protein